MIHVWLIRNGRTNGGLQVTIKDQCNNVLACLQAVIFFVESSGFGNGVKKVEGFSSHCIPTPPCILRVGLLLSVTYP
jgi:hypothetical protein